MKSFPLILFSALLAVSCTKKPSADNSRSFYMGTTPWPADFTDTEINAAYGFINQHCDIVSFHFDEGIPYEEAYNNSGWNTALLQDINIRKTKTAAGKKVLLSSSALGLDRKSKAPYSRFSTGISAAVKDEWQSLPFDDPRVVTAYSNYVLMLVNQLHPDYINFGVESNSEQWADNDFARYKSFLQQVYTRLKTSFSAIPLMVSFMVTEQPKSLQFAAALLPVTDYIALSAYPYTHVSSSANGNTNPDLFPADFFSRFTALDPAKPCCFAETGYIAEPLQVTAFGLNKQGTADWQNKYLEKITAFLNQRKGEFLIWFCSKDYDAGNNTLRSAGLYQDIFALWEDTGLLDENNGQRPAYSTWLAWMNKTKK